MDQPQAKQKPCSVWRSQPPAAQNSKLAAALADGSTSASILNADDTLEHLNAWQETRFKPDQSYVGLTAFNRTIYTCTSNGALRRTCLGEENPSISHKLAALPTRLCDWRMSFDQNSFAYGGDEVELSLWDTARAFSPTEKPTETDAKKRKRGDTLFPGELWRAKNVAHDALQLRQPVKITSLTYLSPSNHHGLLTGTHMGSVRRYDTRAARRPVADWKDVGKVGGVKNVEKGFAEHEVFVTDNGSNLFSLDLRNGTILCGYKGLSGATTSIAPTSTFMASVGLDRFTRIHTTPLPPQEAGQQVDKKGEVLEKLYMKTTPTVIVWDGEVASSRPVKGSGSNEASDGEDEDVWDDMEHVGDSEEENGGQGARRKGKKSKRG
ncbi:hypothetical protein HWV62_33385 [Athelia sp. TMB]|nr:hypothetical protein HWV62_33385 [Athelia sp. TMB]